MIRQADEATNLDKHIVYVGKKQKYMDAWSLLTVACQSTPRVVRAFHADMSPKAKDDILQGFWEGRIRIIVATVAFGMEEIVYVQVLENFRPVIKFVALKPLQKADAESITRELVEVMEQDLGQTDWRDKLCAAGVDGANVMLGHVSGVVTRLKDESSGQHVLGIHCSGHKLELAYKNTLNDVAYFRNVTDTLHTLYKFYQSAQPEMEEDGGDGICITTDARHAHRKNSYRSDILALGYKSQRKMTEASSTYEKLNKEQMERNCHVLAEVKKLRLAAGLKESAGILVESDVGYNNPPKGRVCEGRRRKGLPTGPGSHGGCTQTFDRNLKMGNSEGKMAKKSAGGCDSV
ncbi:hypothetical protein Bbelb_318110 [Branchiostoma belcheri]|nr:hypothetical protein Bbelb_318110 [Branchiostoma belcheri]